MNLNHQLAIQARDLCDRINQRMWEAAASKQTDIFERLENLERKAISRYERRYKKVYGQDS